MYNPGVVDMTRPKNPLFSFQAHGTLAKHTAFRRRQRTTVAERLPLPTDQMTAPQLLQRGYFQSGVDAWHTLTDAERAFYRSLNPRIGGNPAYLNFMREWLMSIVPVHGTRHETGGADEINIQDLLGSPVGPCQNPPDIGDHSFTRYIKPGAYHWSPLVTLNSFPTTSLATPNTLIVTPYPIYRETTFDRIAIHIASPLAGLIRLGIYADNGLTYPGDLILDAGTVDTTTGGLKAIAISQTLGPGLIWLAWLSNANCAIWYTNAGYRPLIGTTDGHTGFGSYYTFYAFGTLPASYPGGATAYNRTYAPLLRRIS